jgi:hypothetical protein
MKSKKFTKLLSVSFLVFAATLFYFTACKKDEKPQSKSETKIFGQRDFVGKRKHVNQKVYDLPGNKILEAVKKFREGLSKNKNYAARLVEADSIKLDSAVWMIEAALNFEFDRPREGSFEDWRSDTLKITVDMNIVNNKLDADDIETIYTTFQSSLQDSSASIYVMKLIDIEGYVDPENSVGYIVGNILKWKGTSATCPDFNVGPNYGPFIPATNYMGIHKNELYAGFTGNCTSPPNPATITVPSATAAINLYRSCTSLSHDCSSFPQDVPCWTNITPYFQVIQAYNGNTVNPNPGELWWSGIHDILPSSNFYCTLANTYVTGAQLNTYLNNQIQFALGWYTYGAPDFLEPVDRFVWGFTNFTPYWYGTYHNDATGFWAMNLTYASYHCINVN